MKKTSLQVVFFGSGPVAAKSLELLAADIHIEAVVTKPRPPHHRGEVPVIETSKRLDIPFRTVKNKQELASLFATRPFASKLGILIDFGIIVPKTVIDYFPFGIVNSHFSILPEWRGADPITFSVLSGQPSAGVSLMLLVPAMDEGPLLAVARYTLSPTITGPELTDALIALSHSLLTKTLPGYIDGHLAPVAQDTTTRTVSYSRKLTKEDGVIDWHKPAAQLEREVRAFIAWPKSHTKLAGLDIIITKAHTIPGNGPDKHPGDVESSLLADGILMIETIDGRLCIDRLKPAGKREMSAREFLSGNKL